MDMSHEAAKEAAFIIPSHHAGRRPRARGCRIVIRRPVSATQGANRAELVDSEFLEGSHAAFAIHSGNFRGCRLH
jgi:hypothetical protein